MGGVVAARVETAVAKLDLDGRWQSLTSGPFPVEEKERKDSR